MANATRVKQDGTKRIVVVGAPSKRDRFSPEAKAILEPSISAIEVKCLLGRPDNYLAGLRKASRPFRFEVTEAYLAARRSLDHDKSLSPSRREDLQKALRSAAFAAQQFERREDRKEAARWVRLVRRYEANRDWFLTVERQVRVALAKRFERELIQAMQNQIPPSSKEDGRRRTKVRNELRRYDRASRKQWGWRGASEGRTARLPYGPDNMVDPADAAKAEFSALVATQATGNRNHGVEICSDPYAGIFDDAQGLTLAQRLAREVKEFRARRDAGEDDR